MYCDMFLYTFFVLFFRVFFIAEPLTSDIFWPSRRASMSLLENVFHFPPAVDREAHLRIEKKKKRKYRLYPDRARRETYLVALFSNKNGYRYLVPHR
jgi:hypothetical protein